MDVQQLYIGDTWMLTQGADRTLQFQAWSNTANAYVVQSTVRPPPESE